jgi:hypothetical protein
MIRALILLLALLGQGGCADPSDRSGSVVSRSATCAMCGATVTGDYFFNAADRGMGPTNR